jgi:hypothetical protein
LRTAPSKHEATLFDFLVRPPVQEEQRDVFESERTLMKRELSRAFEVAAAALNGPEARAALEPLVELFGLYELLGETYS